MARFANSSVLTMTSPPRGTSAMFAFSAAGFIATSTFGASPGVRMSWSAKCNWNDETPGSVPAGARISAGKFGSVDRSLPNDAVSDVNRSPVSCMPSPESPAKRMITRSRRRTSFAGTRRTGVPGCSPAAAPSAVRAPRTASPVCSAGLLTWLVTELDLPRDKGSPRRRRENARKTAGRPDAPRPTLRR